LKRIGGLWEQIWEPANLREAFSKAAKGKWARSTTRDFATALDANLRQMREAGLVGALPSGSFTQFTIYDPKERTIHAAAFSERVVHHAVMNRCEPFFDQWLDPDCYACRKGKGRLVALARASGHMRRFVWFLKMDIRKYFDSVDHAILTQMLERKFKDPQLLAFFRQRLADYETASGKGLPIGSLLSQHFANFYLSALDQYVRRDLRLPAMVRYMDDVVVWSEEKSSLLAALPRIKGMLEQELGLALKPNVQINRTALGVDFLGVRLRGASIRLNHRSRVRFSRKWRGLEQAYWAGAITERQLQQRSCALIEFTRWADASSYRLGILQRFGTAATGLEPCEPRRQLEQQRVELPVGETQQEQPGQPEQQPGLPPLPCPSSAGRRMPSRPNRQPSCPAMTNCRQSLTAPSVLVV